MASQREWESVVWHFLGDTLKHESPNAIKDWIYDFVPSTPTQEDRWLNAVNKVQQQLERFAGDANACDEECKGNTPYGD